MLQRKKSTAMIDKKKSNFEKGQRSVLLHNYEHKQAQLLLSSVPTLL